MPGLLTDIDPDGLLEYSVVFTERFGSICEKPGSIFSLARRKKVGVHRRVAANGFQSPTVVVCYTDDADIQNGKKFAAEGEQIAAGVPLMCDEPDNYKSFRIGLFGLDKIGGIDRAVENLAQALDAIVAS